MSSLAAVSLILGVLWTPLLYFAVRHRDLVTVAVVLWVWAANYLIGTGEVTTGRLISIPWVLTVSALLVDRMLKDPAHVAHVAASQVAEARRMAHDHVADALAKFSRDLAKERLEQDRLEGLLDEHGIAH